MTNAFRLTEIRRKVTHLEINYFKRYRSGFLSRDGLIHNYKKEVDWFADQMTHSIIHKLGQYCPSLIQEFDQLIQQIAIQINRLELRACQQNIRLAYRLLREIKPAIEKIDFLIQAEELFEKIDYRILRYSGFHFPTIRQFATNLELARAALKSRAYRKAWFYTQISYGDLNITQHERLINKCTATELNARCDHLLATFQATSDWTTYVAGSISTNRLETVVVEVRAFCEERRYILVDRLLGDLELQFADRSAFHREYLRAERIMPEREMNKQKMTMRMVMNETGWSAATQYLVHTLSNYVKNDL